MSFKFTQSAIKKLSTKTRMLVADSGCQGLYIDVRPTNSTYRFRYTDNRKLQRTITIGDVGLIKLSDARTRARELARRILNGEEFHTPTKLQNDNEPKYITFEDFFINRYLPQAELTSLSLKTEICTVKINVFPAIGDLALIKITKGEITALLHKLISKGQAPATVNRTLAHIRAIFNRAIEWEIDGIEKNPAKGIRTIPNNRKHERYLSPQEAKRLMDALSRSANKFLPLIVQFLLFQAVASVKC